MTPLHVICGLPPPIKNSGCVYEGKVVQIGEYPDFVACNFIDWGFYSNNDSI